MIACCPGRSGREATCTACLANSGGSTREVAIDPPDTAPGAPFRWRISCASVASDGPFSMFPGIDRSLWLLRGSGLRLDVDGREVLLERPLQRIDFAGETLVHAHLLAGAIEDLNVFVEPATTSADARVLTLSPESCQALSQPRSTTVVLDLDGELQVDGATPLCTGDALRLDADDATALVAASAGAATVLVGSFVRRRGA